MQNLKVRGSIPHGDSEFFLCPVLVTRQKTSFLIMRKVWFLIVAKFSDNKFLLSEKDGSF